MSNVEIQCDRPFPHLRHLADDQYNLEGARCPGIPDEGRPKLIETIAAALAAIDNQGVEPRHFEVYWIEEIGDYDRDHFREQAALVADAVTAAGFHDGKAPQS